MSKVVLITGASSGIGKTIGEYLIEKKFKVYGTCRNPLNYPNSIIELIKSNINSIDGYSSFNNGVRILVKDDQSASAGTGSEILNGIYKRFCLSFSKINS